MLHKRSMLIIFVLSFLTACDLISNTIADPTPIPAVNAATPVTAPNATPILPSTPDIADSIIITAVAPSLTIWLPPDTLLDTEAGTLIFSDQLLSFNAQHPDLETRVEQKPVKGQGGIMSYLRTGANVAPGILPDLILLPTSQLATAASEGLIFPLDDLLDPAALDDLYPAARSLAQIEDQIIGYPFAISNMTHLVYQTSVITNTPPLLWSELIATKDANLIFPAAGIDGTMLTLQFYLAAGGTLTNEAGQPALDAPLLAQALQQLSQGRANGFILQQSSNAFSMADSWAAFQTGTADFTLATTNQFLVERTPEIAPGYATIAGLDGPLTPLVDSWAWAISTADPARRALAGELLSTLIDGANLGEWSLQSHHLPARRQAFTVWPHDDAYLSFIHLELERAQPRPIEPDHPIMEALSNATFDVISLAKSPQEAAGEAVTAIQP